MPTIYKEKPSLLGKNVSFLDGIAHWFPVWVIGPQCLGLDRSCFNIIFQGLRLPAHGLGSYLVVFKCSQFSHHMMGIRGHEKVGRGSINNVKAKVHLGPNLLHNSYVERIFLLLIKKAIIFGER